MRYVVTIHKQTATTVEIEDATDGDDAIAKAHAGTGKVIDQKTVSAQFIPQESPLQA